MNIQLNKDKLYWSRGCLSGKNERNETCCKSVGSCHKLTVFNWLKDIPADREYDVVEIRFKNTRKAFFRNVNKLHLKEGDIVAVEASPGHDIGLVSALGPVAEIKLMKLGVEPATAELRKIYRMAKSADIDKWQDAVSMEYPTMIRARQLAVQLGLNMKIGDVDFQGDKTKAIFYYIADERVDFRELIKAMADVFKIRIEMRQIGARQEAGLIGGIGPCGRELCCAQWMTNFVSVSTTAARYQDLSVNPLKLAGQCGKLKCCLNYELDTYLEALKDFPQLREPLQTAAGPMYLQKTDALKAVMWFASEPSSSLKMIAVPVGKVREIQELNRRGEKPELLAIDEDELTQSEFRSAVGEDSLTRFDTNKKKRPKPKPKQSGNSNRNNASWKNAGTRTVTDNAGNGQQSASAEQNVQDNARNRAKQATENNGAGNNRASQNRNDSGNNNNSNNNNRQKRNGNRTRNHPSRSVKRQQAKQRNDENRRSENSASE
jgi:cell fate regulator YaaT (PSP1 superfamily)